ncbi:hypothetical protein ACH5RR_007166 [Cinchona calisaya]|uniref:Uncharacterized protein n=1 Tax=Cinchona calisaya TaxID=153742 RepID=A0ABD3AR59_9GENT
MEDKQIKKGVCQTTARPPQQVPKQQAENDPPLLSKTRYQAPRTVINGDPFNNDSFFCTGTHFGSSDSGNLNFKNVPPEQQLQSFNTSLESISVKEIHNVMDISTSLGEFAVAFHDWYAGLRLLNMTNFHWNSFDKYDIVLVFNSNDFAYQVLHQGECGSVDETASTAGSIEG